MDVSIIVENIQHICTDRGVTPTTAARESGAGKDLISNMKRKGTLPSIEKIRLLADYLNVTANDILGTQNDALAVSPDDPPASEDQLMAAFWGGDKDLSPEDKAAMWSDVKNFAAFLAQKKREEKRQDG